MAVIVSLTAHSIALAQDDSYEFLLRNCKVAASPVDISNSVSRAIVSDKITINRVSALVAGNLLSGRSKSLHIKYLIDIFDKRCQATVRFADWYETDALRMYGDISGPLDGQFVIVADKGYLTGRIYDFANGKSYKLIHLRADKLVALVDYDLDESLMGSPYDRLGVDTSERAASSFNASVSEQLEDARPAAKTATIDLLIQYTEKANTSSISADIMEMVTNAQLAMGNSEINVTLKAVKIQKINFKETTNGEADLKRFTNNKTVQKWRNAYGADLVVVITNSTKPEYGGISSQLNRSARFFRTAKSQAYALVDYTSGIWSYTFAHELGHMLGAGHSKQQSIAPDGGYYSYSNGWQWTDSSNNHYCTVMTYTDNKYTRKPYYSNPDVKYGGIPTGTKKANNAKAIGKLMTYVSKYRKSKSGGGGGNVVTNSIGMKLKQIPAGSFMMGAVPGDSDAGAVEKPQHRVEITKPFYIGVCEVTQAQYRAVMGNNPSIFKGDACPVENVNWNDAVGFCRKLSQREGVTYRLPTEAEWEYACRAGAETIFYWGNNFDGSYAWYYENGNQTTHPVGAKRPNAWGLYDMSGNVWEWCQDWYGEYYYGSSPLRDPQGPSSGTYRVLRGGSWLSALKCLRSSHRSYCYPDPGFDFGFDTGFRIVREVK